MIVVFWFGPEKRDRSFMRETEIDPAVVAE
jgi:hypothetical protein